MTAHPLGRRVDHDERSLQHHAARATTQHSVLWGHNAPVLDQGQISSCTGNATAQLINTDYFAASRPHGYLTEPDALQIYETATVLDSIPDNTYPPTDDGSSGLGAAKAGVQLGYFTAYKHSFGFDHFAATLQLQPVIVGTDWYTDMFTPDQRGYIKPSGTVEGGHEYLALGISWETKTLIFLNSWGDSWAHGGRFYMTFDDFTQLLGNQGDATAPLPKATA